MLDRTAQPRLDPQALDRLGIHLRREEGHGIAPAGLGAVHGRIGMLQQGIGRVRVPRVDADAQTGADEQFMPVQRHPLRQHVQDLLRHRHDVAHLRHVGQHQHELVAPQPRHGVSLAHTGGQAFGHGLQQLVAVAVAEAVVDGLEAVQIEHHHPGDAVGTPGVDQRLRQPVGEQVPVGQTREGVVGGLALQCGGAEADDFALLGQRVRHAVERDHDLAQFAARIGCPDRLVELAGIQTRDAQHQPRRLTPHGELPQARRPEKHQQRHQQHARQRTAEGSIHLGMQLVLRHAQHQAQAGVAGPRQRRTGPDARLRTAAQRPGWQPGGAGQHQTPGRGIHRQSGRMGTGVVHDEGSIVIPDLDIHLLEGQGRRHRTPVVVQVQRRQHDEAQPPLRIPHGVGDLQHGLAGQPADHRLDHMASGRERAPEIPAVIEVEPAAAAQRVAVQLPVRPDRQQAGVLRVFAQHFGQEDRAGVDVRQTQLRHPRQTEEQLCGAADLVVQIAGEQRGSSVELCAHLGQGRGTLFEQHPDHGHQRQQRGHHHQPEDAGAQAHGAGAASTNPCRTLTTLVPTSATA